MADSNAPLIRIEELRIEGLKSIKLMRWPEGGLGWHGQVPNLVTLGGGNGSGKTTFLDFMAATFDVLLGGASVLPEELVPKSASLRFSINGDGARTLDVDCAIGPQCPAPAPECQRSDGPWLRVASEGATALDLPGLWKTLAIDPKLCPNVVSLPSEGRDLAFPEEPLKGGEAFPNGPKGGGAVRWSRGGSWKESTEALIRQAQWNDFVSKEQGRAVIGPSFASLSQRIVKAFEGYKWLEWDEGELLVKSEDGTIVHDLQGLSSGERQMVVFLVELERHWRPGSLVLIDEPELHLHRTWETRLFMALEDMLKDRGGQLIMATQSTHFFGLGEPLGKALMGWARS